MEISKDRLYPAICIVLVVAAVLATIPVLEMGTNDDWSYNWVARELAATGHFNLQNGWIGAMIGVQAYWAALLIRCFGFSFTLVRLSTLPFAAGCAVLLYRLGRAAGLNPSFALFATLSITLSPVFIPVAASFMTDVPGCFFWLAGIYCALRAARATSTTGACAWMTAAAVAGAAGGTIRQVVWFVPLTTLSAVAWIRRRERSAVVCALLLWLASSGAMELCLRWLNAQTYSALAVESPTDTWLDLFLATIQSILEISVGTLLLMLPVLSTFVRRKLPGWKPLAAGLAGAVALLAGLMAFGDDLLLGNIITPTGMLGGLDLLGTKPVILTVPIRFLIGAALVATAGVTAGTLYETRRWPTSDLRRFIVLCGLPTLVYIAAITYRSDIEWILFDRYFIPILPLLVVPLLWQYQEHNGERPPLWGWAIIGLFALFGIANTHDYFAAGRARVQAATTAILAGIPRTRISAGLEYDGWTQVEQTGHLASAAEQAAQSRRRYPVSPPYWYWAKTPAVDPEYVVTYSRLPGLVDSQFPPVEYTAWLPPFHREVFTQKAPPATSVGRRTPRRSSARRR